MGNQWHPDAATAAGSAQFVDSNGNFVGKSVVAASGSLRLVSGVLILIPPTSNPGVSGALWNNGGSPAIS